MSLISIGTDSEIFARNAQGKAIALCGKIGGSKDNPKPIQSLGNGFFVQEDNVSLEFNIPPVNSSYEWDIYIDATVKELAKLLEKMSLYFTPDASISFDKDQLMHPNALVFGCEPDFNAWTKMENEKPMCSNPALRTAGGHVHVGTRANMIQCVEMMDLFLGVPSVILDDSPASINRRVLYGKAGAMRPKPYGFEYRVLSNFWIFTSELRKWVYKNTERAVELGQKINPKDSYLIQECINTGNKALAKDLIARHSIPMPGDKKANKDKAESIRYAPPNSFSIAEMMAYSASLHTTTTNTMTNDNGSTS